ncbi:WAP four-disulfide core domain protein 2-like [Lissotriton helveticus]
MRMAGNFLILLVVGLFPGSYLLETGATNVEERPGVCPPPVGMALEACTDLCTVDADCHDLIRKCCKTGCNGMSCKVPNEKPGECPVVKESDTKDCADKKVCTSDSECADSHKCCNSSCDKYYCQTPEVLQTTASGAIVP